MTKEFNVYGMMCEKCTERVKNALLALDEVEDVKVNLEDKIVSLELKENLSDEKIKQLIEDLGFEIEF